MENLRKLRSAIYEKFDPMTDFARVLGIRDNTLSHIITRRSNASPGLKERIAQELEIPIGELFPPDPPSRQRTPQVKAESRRAVGE
jgi:transcriptional regulator with XRE-family HTH domain